MVISQQDKAMAKSYPAYAKINLGLRILEKRSDGYHNIETVFHKIDLFDVIEFSSAPTLSVASSSMDAPSDESNICYKAAKQLRELLGVDEGVHISITKNIPVGGGLGGGSSDAATVLRYLPRFWNRTVDPETLKAIALHLGSDVPFFLGNSSALGRGRGEQLEFFSLEIPYYILVCNPNIYVSTAWAYRNVVPNKTSERQSLTHIRLNGLDNPSQLASALRNDFELVVFREYPAILQVKESMTRGGAVFASMSGSGSSVFGFFREEGTVTGVMETLRAKNYRVFLTRPHFTA